MVKVTPQPVRPSAVCYSVPCIKVNGPTTNLQHLFYKTRSGEETRECDVINEYFLFVPKYFN